MRFIHFLLFAVANSETILMDDNGKNIEFGTKFKF